MAAELPGPGEASPRHGEGLEVLFEALEGPLLCYALRLLKDREMAEDIVQEAFLRLHRQPGTVEQPRSWLYRTVHNLAVNHLRAGARVVPLAAPVHEGREAEEDAADPQPLPDEQLARWEGVGLVRLGLDALDARSREVVQLKFQEDLSYKEISQRTGLTSGHIGYILHHALKSLAAELTKAGLLP